MSGVLKCVCGGGGDVSPKIATVALGPRCIFLQKCKRGVSFIIRCRRRGGPSVAKMSTAMAFALISVEWQVHALRLSRTTAILRCANVIVRGDESAPRQTLVAAKVALLRDQQDRRGNMCKLSESVVVDHFATSIDSCCKHGWIQTVFHVRMCCKRQARGIRRDDQCGRAKVGHAARLVYNFKNSVHHRKLQIPNGRCGSK